MHDISSMCANVDQMCDTMCSKVFTTDKTDISLFWECASEQETTKIYTISGYHLGVLHGPHRYHLYVYLRFASGVGFGIKNQGMSNPKD